MREARKILWSLRAIIILVVILVLILSLNIFFQTKKLVSLYFNQQQFSLAGQAASSIRSFLEETESGLNTLARVTSIQDCYEIGCYEDMMAMYKSHQPSMSRILRIDSAGNVLYALEKGESFVNPAENLAQDSLFQEVHRTLKPQWSTIRPDRWGSRTVTVAVPVIRYDPAAGEEAGTFDGVLMASIGEAYLADTYIRPIRSGENGYAYVMDGDGRILIHTARPETTGASRDDIRDSDEFKAGDPLPLRMLKGESGTGAYNFRDAQKYVAFAPMVYDDLQWSIAVCAPADEITAPIRMGFWYYLLTLGIIIVTFGGMAVTAEVMARRSRRRNFYLEHLYRLSSLSRNSSTPEELAGSILESLQEMEGVEEACICLKDGSFGKVESRTPPGSEEDVCELFWKKYGERIPGGGVPLDEPILIEPGSSAPSGEGVHRELTWISLPIVLEDKILGMINLGTATRKTFSEDRLRFLKNFTDETAVSLNNLTLFQVLRDRTLLLEQANRVKSDFLSVVSHELRTPLAVIIGFLNLLQEGRFEGRPTDMKELSEVSVRRAHDLEKLINSLLDLTRIEEGRMEVLKEVVDPQITLRGIHGLFLPQAERLNINLEMELPRKKHHCLGDINRIRQILDNLISNALKFTPAGGKVTIGFRPGEEEVIFFVSDTGPGIPEGKMKAIFERFYQLDSSMTRKYGGTGLGLAISRELAKLQDGRIWAENGPEGGAVFNLSLPAARPGDPRKKAPTPVSKKKPAEPAKKKAAPEKILVIDDDQDFLKMTSLLLKDRGYEVTSMNNALDGLKHLYEKKADLIILDLVMHGFSGSQFLAALAGDPDRSRLPVIIMTGATEKKGDFSDVPSIRKILIKPVEITDLQEVIESVLQEGGVRKK